ncbi:MAG: hypothetical protein WAT19_01400 [Ferruginibacter sp.]
MNINRHNYESFFLLYADKELSAPEKNAVEFFVQQNPDLKEEFDQLQELVLPADKLGFDKTGLFKKEDSISALEEKMLMQLDGELNEVQAKELEALLQEDKDLQATYALLQKTKLDPADAPAFENKKILYRYERARLVNMRVLRWAAAAIFLGFGLFAGIKLLNPGTPVANSAEIPLVKKPSGAGTAAKLIPGDSSSQQVQNKKTNEAVAVNNNNINNGSTVKDNAVIATDPVPENKKTNQGVLVKRSLKQKDLRENKQPGGEEETMAATDPKNNRSLTVNKTVQQQLPEQRQPGPEKLIAQAPEKVTIDDGNETLVPLRESFARQAVFTEPETAGNDKILYMDEDNITRSKTGVIFRKLKRVVERKAKIKPGKSLKIAGFEIAAR